MARITVEDCLVQIPNRFLLVMVAAKRAKQLYKGAQPLIENKQNNNSGDDCEKQQSDDVSNSEDRIVYDIDSSPPWHLCVVFGLQVSCCALPI